MSTVRGQRAIGWLPWSWRPRRLTGQTAWPRQPDRMAQTARYREAARIAENGRVLIRQHNDLLRVL